VIDSAERGQTKVQETISGIGSIRENTQVVEEMIHDFSAKAKQIGGIINVIDDVADETNLLALNAAVIAAQSGEQGRAFSVVADEINELADRVLSSTKEISNLIKSVQQSASDAVVAIARGTESVESGLNLSQEAGNALEEITSSARESGTRMHEVVAAVGEQSRAAEHLARMMTEVIETIKQIEVVSKDQSESTEAVIASNEAMSVAAEQIQQSNLEQARSTDAIKGHVNQVRQVTTGISSSLVEEARKVALVGQLLEAVNDSAVTNEESTASMTQAADVLLDEAANLREGIKRFKI
jgi:methyl-accepting chemotaxis protein